MKVKINSKHTLLNKKKIGSLAFLSAIPAGVIGNHSAKKAIDSKFPEELEKEDEKIKKKLKRKAKKDYKFRILDEPGFENSAFAGKEDIEDIRKIFNELPKGMQKKILNGEMGMPGLKGIDIKKLLKEDKDTIIMGGGKSNKGFVLSHEMGHGHYSTDEKDKETIPGKVHKFKNRKIESKISQGGTLLGPVAAIFEKPGGASYKKTALIGATTAATKIPKLIREKNATKKGLEMMKEAGASEEEIKHAKKIGKNAYRSYIMNGLAVPTLLSSGSYLMLRGK